MADSHRSRLALWVCGVYLLFGLGSWVLPLVASPEDSLSAVFLILFAQPWASLWIWVADQLKLESMWPSMAFMLIGILINTWLLYKFFSWLSSR